MDPRFMTYNSGPLWLLILIMTYSIIQYFGSGDDADEEAEENLVEGLASYQDALKEEDKSCIIG